MDAFLKYRAGLNSSRSGSEDDVTIQEVIEMDIPLQADEMNGNSRSRATNSNRVKLHRISFSSKGEKGLSIVSTDERVRSNFMYCEKGSIEDTAYIEPVAEYIREVIPDLCLYDVERYYSGETGEDETLSRAVQPTIYLDIKTKWGQGVPYNWGLPQMMCSGQGGFPLVGCTGIAIAQALVYLLPDGYNQYPINEMREMAYCYTWSERAQVVANFIAAVSASYTELGCDGSGAWLADARTMLANWGFASGVGYIYKATDSLDKGKFYTSLQLGCPTLMSGSNGKGSAHSWMLHGQRYNGSTREVYCNYGWSGSCDGWYSDWQRPRNASGAVVISGSYYKNNKYLYFLQNRSTR